MNHFKQHWKGELPLWVSFWVNYFLLNVFLHLITAVVLMGQMSDQYASEERAIYIVQLYLILNGAQLIVVYPWQMVGLWRAGNRERKETNKKLWPGLAQAVVVIGALWLVVNLTSNWDYYRDLYGVGFEKDYLSRKLNSVPN